MKCVRCGAEIPYRADACRECGLKIADMEAVGRKLEQKRIRESNPFKWTLRDWLTIFGVLSGSGLLLGVALRDVIWGLLLAFTVGGFFFQYFYCESLRYAIWRDLREKALDKVYVKETLIQRIIGWFISVNGAYQRMAGYLVVIALIGTALLMRYRFLFGKVSEIVFSLLALLLALICGLSVISIGATWEQPVAAFKRMYEWLAISAIGIGYAITSAYLVGPDPAMHPILWTLVLFLGGMLVAMYVFGTSVKRAIRKKGFDTPGLI